MSGGGLGAPAAAPGLEVISGPEKIRSELWWRVRLADGAPAVLGQLLPELAGDESVRRRYVYEAERLRDVGARAVHGGEPVLAPIVALGPAPDPRDPAAPAPWRLRRAPRGTTLEAHLAARAPLPVDEALQTMAAIADAVHAVHAAGAVLRDLEPRGVVLAAGGRVWLTDVGLARLDILSSRTASSLMLESSPYAAPEHLRATVVDARADVYTVAAFAWRALTGTIAFGDGPALLRERHPLPPLASLGVDAPGGLDEVLRRCLAEDPDERVESAAELARVFRGEPASGAGSTALARVVCQACGEAIRPGQRLCLACGKQAVQFHHAREGATPASVYLARATEEEKFVRELRAFFETVGEGEPPPLEFVIGDQRMYAKEEREARTKLPARLFANLDPETAEALARRLRDAGMKVRVRRDPQRFKSKSLGILGVIGGSVAVIGSVVGFAVGAPVFGVAALVGGGVALTGGIASWARSERARKKPLAALRAAPAALPASDPLVARLAELLPACRASDVRERLGELALLVQRLVDRRASLAGDGAAFDAVTEPVRPLVELASRAVRTINRVDGELADLDEGTVVRAIAASEARGEPRSARESLLAGLDRLRALEEERAAHMQRLLEASSLIRRAALLGLESVASEGDERRFTAMALAALGAPDAGDESAS